MTLPLFHQSLILTCNDDSTGSIDITVSGGTTNYNYSWSGPNGFTSTNEDISMFVAGSYQITGSDNNGCVIPATTIDVTEPMPWVITLSLLQQIVINHQVPLLLLEMEGIVADYYTYELTDLAGTLFQQQA